MSEKENLPGDQKNRRKIGAEYEAMAAAYLKKNGLDILEQNFRCRQGEIDLVARDGKYLVFVEVKFREREGQGDAIEAVGKRKQEKIVRVALFYLVRRGFTLDTPCRFDVIGIDGTKIHWIRHAFGTGGYI